MAWKGILRNPFLLMGILMFSIFISYINRGGVPTERFRSETCHGLLPVWKKNLGNRFEFSCQKNSLQVTFVKTDQELKDRRKIYSFLAREILALAKAVPQDHLVRVSEVKIILSHSTPGVVAITNGEALVHLSKVQSQEALIEELPRLVMVREITSSSEN